jgi:hypothetical protein
VASRGILDDSPQVAGVTAPVPTNPTAVTSGRTRLMARVAEAELERLKADVSVQRLAEARGVALKKHGADLIGLCPFHNDKKPSLVISPGKNLWHCLGACQAGGSVIDWVMKAEGVNFRHAVELLRADLPVSSPSTRVVKTCTPDSVMSLSWLPAMLCILRRRHPGDGHHR